MKSFISILFLAASAVAFAGPTSDMTWDEIKADRDTLLLGVPFGGTFCEFGIVNACYTETEFRSIAPVRTCTKIEEVEEWEDSAGEGGKKLVIRKYCALFEDLEITVSRNNGTKELPLKYDIDVYTVNDIGASVFAFFKEYTVPKCER